jgi:hypothetical protein
VNKEKRSDSEHNSRLAYRVTQLHTQSIDKQAARDVFIISSESVHYTESLIPINSLVIPNGQDGHEFFGHKLLMQSDESRHLIRVTHSLAELILGGGIKKVRFDYPSRLYWCMFNAL